MGKMLSAGCIVCGLLMQTNLAVSGSQIDLSKLDISQYTAARNAIVDRFIVENEIIWDNQGPYYRLFSIARNFIPGVEAFSTYGLVDWPLDESYLAGSNLEEQMHYLRTLDPDEFEVEFREAARRVRFRAGDYAVLRFARSNKRFGSSDILWRNVTGSVSALALLIVMLVLGNRVVQRFTVTDDMVEVAESLSSYLHTSDDADLDGVVAILEDHGTERRYIGRISKLVKRKLLQMGHNPYHVPKMVDLIFASRYLLKQH